MDVPGVGTASVTQPQVSPVPPVPAAEPAAGKAQDAAGSSRPAAEGALSPVVAKLFAGGGDVLKSISVNVSYRVEHDPNIIVTVFTDPNTGKEIAQVPSEVMIQIAQFFDKQSGVTLDRNA